MTPAGAQRRLQAAVAAVSTALFLMTAPGRIPFPDDEIVFQTTQSLYERGSLAIPGIARRSGEMAGQAKGTFGWAEGRDGARYGFFGHGLSVVALPAYGLAKLTYPWVPPTWRYGVRSDHLAFHDRDPFADWARLVVSLTNCAITGAAAGVLLAWLTTLGFGLRAATLTALGFALGTAAWPYTRTFLSEPLSGLCLLLCALGIARYHRGRRRGDGGGVGWLWAAGAIAGFAAHVHVLNLSALPCLLGYALWPLVREGGGAALRRERRAWGGAALLGLVGVAALGLSHYLRFGSAFETGRFGIYSWLVPPWTGLAALAVAPGRSLLLYAPAVALGFAGIPALRRRLPVVAVFAASMLLVRAATISFRSDWFGGWALGPRHLVPVLPFAILPLAALWERALRAGRGARLALGGLELAAVGVTLYLSLYSILEWMIHLSRDPAVRAFGSVSDASHWWWSASPLAGYHTLKVDVLSVGAWRLAQRGHWGLLVIFACIAAAGLGAAAVIVRTLRRRPHGA
jgi:hypothetical protein